MEGWGWGGSQASAACLGFGTDRMAVCCLGARKSPMWPDCAAPLVHWNSPSVTPLCHHCDRDIFSANGRLHKV